LGRPCGSGRQCNEDGGVVGEGASTAGEHGAVGNGGTGADERDTELSASGEPGGRGIGREFSAGDLSAEDSGASIEFVWPDGRHDVFDVFEHEAGTEYGESEHREADREHEGICAG